MLRASCGALRLAIAAAVAGACGGGGGGSADAGAPDAVVPPPVAPFPAGFLWGTAIAPYQVEGGLHATDWYQWETLGLCGDCPEGEHADDGPDFWTHYPDDLAAAAALSTNAIRLGIDWSRVFPTAESFPDAPDADAVATYHDMLATARAEGLSVMVTLHHFATPVWLHDLTDLDGRPGWVDPATAEAFATFAGWAAAEFGGEVDLWITINEPIPYVLGGWIAGSTPPGKSFDIDGAFAVLFNLIDAHARAYDAIHEADAVDADGDGIAAQVSIAHHMRVYLPLDPGDPDHVRATDMIRYLSNDFVLNALVRGDVDRNFDFDADDPEDTRASDALRGRLDFVGLNYYGVSLVVPTANDNNFPVIGLPLQSNLDRQGFDAPQTDFGWAIYPSGLREVLDELQAYGLPIIVTENGLADATDAQRPRFLLDHLYELARAIGDGIDVRGYFHWSLMDNFEWSSGFCPRFGLYRVDYGDPDRRRTAGEGAAVYRRIIEANAVPVDLFADYGYPGSETLCPTLPL
ncbi:MAG: glycoside hydrolase family 1 protein [Deltaproteobacteria bacterium]|nr:MAG: glycoside hydrolase family 1 protein [Deltaproteobacteria bacterium]